MDADLPSLRETLADVTELLALSTDDGGAQPEDLVTLKANLETIIAHKELENSKNAALQAVAAAFSDVPSDDTAEGSSSNDLFANTTDEELPGELAG